MTPAMAASISSLIVRYCAYKSANGTVMRRLFHPSSRILRAGFPAYTPACKTSFVTTAPAPMTVPLQMVTGRMVAFDPMETRLPTRVARHSSRRPCAGPPLENVSLMNITPCPMNALLADRYELADEGVRLHLGSRADHDPALNLHERSNGAAVAQGAFVQVDGLHDSDVLPACHSTSRRLADSRCVIQEGHALHPSRHRLGWNRS